MWLATWAARSRVRRITELAPPLWINLHPNPWVLSLRWYVNLFLQTSLWETITVRIGLKCIFFYSSDLSSNDILNVNGKQVEMANYISFKLLASHLAVYIMNSLLEDFTFTFMHLADAFIQSDLQCIQVIHFFVCYVCSLGIEPTTSCAANAMLYHWATGTLGNTVAHFKC